jgi:hypothetical protein
MWDADRGVRVRDYLLLSAALLLVTLLWCASPQRFVASDPWVYARNAWQLLSGDFAGLTSKNHVFQHRLGVYAPVAAVYSILPVNPRSTSLVPLLALGVILVAVWAALSDFRSRLFALFFAVTCVPLLSSTTALFPDVIVAAAVTTSLFMLARRHSSTRWRQMLLGALGTTALFLGFLAKETAIWAAPVWLACVLYDCCRRDPANKPFHAAAVVAAVAWLALYFLICNGMFGDPLARLSSVQSASTEHAWRIKSETELWSRLTTQPLPFLSESLGPLPVFAAISYPLLEPRRRLWFFAALCGLLLFWFGTVSLTSYQPLPLRARMLLPFIPALCVLAGAAAARLPFAASWPTWKRDGLLLVLLTGFFAPRLAEYAGGWRKDGEVPAMKRVAREVNAHPETRFLLVGSSPRAGQFLAIYFGFQPPPNLTIASPDRLTAAMLERTDQAFLLMQTRGGNQRALRRNTAAMTRLGLPVWFSRHSATVYVAQQTASLEPLISKRKRKRKR